MPHIKANSRVIDSEQKRRYIVGATGGRPPLPCPLVKASSLPSKLSFYPIRRYNNCTGKIQFELLKELPVQSELSLVQLAKQRDEAAFCKLYEAYFDKVFRYVALKIGDRMEAEDITQQVFLNALKSISSYEIGETPFSAWLFRIAHNQMVDFLRKKTKRPSVPLENAPPQTGGEDPEEITSDKFDIEELNAATQKLTDLQREVISLRFASELSINEAARIMGKSEGAIKALQHSAILALRRTMVTQNENE
jgi:RNA polymerase sigma-70 factor (ECF subfamily)